MKQLPRNSILMNYITASLFFFTGFIPFNFSSAGSGKFFLGLGWLIFYFAEPWAFNFKIRLSRIRILSGLTEGNPEKIYKHKNMGGLIWFAFLIRLVFRFLILIIAFTILGVLPGPKEMPTWMLLIYIFAMLFELSAIFWPIYTLRLDSGINKEEDKEGEKAEEKMEKEWRRENFPLLSRADTFPKELVADILLSLYAIVATKSFWNMINDTFTSYIISSARDGSGAFETAISTAIPIFILAFIFLIPVRLAYWVGESIRINTGVEKRHYYLSLCVATFFIILPTIQTFVKVFFL